ncbi:MAG: tRNA uridine-5-carboxymethylaminomethyl(34) synthesis GTPase MnmE [Saprospiraceae bacterium]|nr:tRNA uridine-5-carboxymethylaminomethyl(34) synthesis GTPase MnmE [Saprospiraceae bacterium]MDW8229512.1 tRNA uridine-5-carboxymethylaminomethyl(34) synthesis GTPase MnmE [Saprospiraceae bacterium]
MPTLPDLTDTIAALATPPGTGAIAVVRLSGPRAVDIADAVFRGKRLHEQCSHTAHVGRIEDEDGHILDEAVVTLFRAPRSYTGEDVVEFSVHGSPYVQQAVLGLLLRRGARLAAPGEFTLRAFLNGKIDLTQAEAVADLIASQTSAAHAVAMRQLRGGFKTEIARLREELIHFASLIELELDFAEEDVEFANRAHLEALVEKIQTYLTELMHSFQLGNALRYGVATVIAGRPNAGKSTLLNALLNEERAIVSDIAGTTRDTIEEVINLGGVPFRLTDTAGIREAQDAIEAIGVRRALEKIEQAAIVVYVWDISETTLAEAYSDLQTIGHKLIRPAETPHPQAALIVVCNKMDRNPYFLTEWLLQPNAPEIPTYLRPKGDAPLDPNMLPLKPAAILPLSAKNRMNIEYLKETLLEVAIGKGVNIESAIAVNARHYEALRRANEALSDVLAGLKTGISGEWIAQDIRRALACLGEITGEVGVEDILGNIFSRFCIGK